MKILLLCNKSPFPPREGGPIAMNMIVEGLMEAGHEVRILAFNSNKYFIPTESIPSDYREKTKIRLIPVDLSLKAKDAFLNLFSSQSYHVQRFISQDFRKNLEDILKKESFDVVQFEMIYMAPYLDSVRKYSSAKTVLRTHNIEHLIWERVAAHTRQPFKKIYLKYLAEKLKRYECSVIREFDGIAAITEKDAKYFREISGDAAFSEKITSIPFGIDFEQFPESSVLHEFPSLFSLGSMDWIPNLEGISWFLEKV
ncbi:MAG: glycosyltransferase, partial [Bacteroidota bacterium]|nr:glycosyltransferase [Bacteroidota bacterium]